ncbi:hypothetical protein M3J09_007301 [Ascochyta lentis]
MQLRLNVVDGHQFGSNNHVTIYFALIEECTC